MKLKRKDEQEIFDHFLSLLLITKDNNEKDKYIVIIPEDFQMLVSAYQSMTYGAKRPYIPDSDDEDFDLLNMLVTYKIGEILFEYLKEFGYEKDNKKYDFYYFSDRYETVSEIIDDKLQKFYVLYDNKNVLECDLIFIEKTKDLKYELKIRR